MSAVQNPVMTFDLLSPLPLAECVRRLKAATDGAWAVAGSKPVLGSVGDKSLRLRQRTYYRHSSQCWLSGKFVEENGQTRLRCSTGLHPFVRVFLEYWIGAVFLGGGAVFVWTVRSLWGAHGPLPPNLWLGLIVPPLMLFFGAIFLAFGDYFSGEESRFLVEFVERTIDAHEV
jgi:hypothetical protein